MTTNNAINSTLASPFTVGATSVTSTGTQLNYLNALTAVPFNKIAVQRITTSGAGTYTPTAGMTFVIVQAQAAGGGGGGAASAGAAQFAIGQGGSGGEYIEALFNSSQIGASKPYVVGAKGAKGAAGNNNGTNGGNTTFNTTWIITNGGTFGSGGATAAASQFFVNPQSGGSGGSVATGTILNQIIGGPNGLAFALVSQAQTSAGGNSGSGVIGGITQALTTTSLAGLNGTLGSGGSGGATFNAGSAAAGGDGGDGFITFIEFLSA